MASKIAENVFDGFAYKGQNNERGEIYTVGIEENGKVSFETYVNLQLVKREFIDSPEALDTLIRKLNGHLKGWGRIYYYRPKS